MTTLQVQATGALALVQDLGREAWMSSGVSRAGAADRTAFSLANRLVGNPPGAAAIEALFGGLCVSPSADCVVAVTGAPAGVSIDGRAHDRCRALLLRSGQALAIGEPAAGVRVYVAFRTGIDAPLSLDSRSRDTLGGIGPPPLQPGDQLSLGGCEPVGEAWFESVVAPDVADQVTLDIVPGPHDDVLGPAGWGVLLDQAWRVHPDSDRIGTRLDGLALDAPAGDRPSFPVLPGSVQLPPDGRPIVLGPDAGVTGGYPVIGVVGDSDLDALAQARPGSSVRFRLRRDRVRPGV